MEEDRHDEEEGDGVAGDDDPGHLRARRGSWTSWRTSSLFEETPRRAGQSGAKNHQYLGVNNALESLRETGDATRASWACSGTRRAAARAISMVFFAQKVLRKLPGNWTFVVVTDREDLDEQIYKNFADDGGDRKPEARSMPRAAST